MKNLQLEIRIAKYEMDQLTQEAKRRGMTRSELVRRLIAKFPEPMPNKIREAKASRGTPD